MPIKAWPPCSMILNQQEPSMTQPCPRVKSHGGKCCGGNARAIVDQVGYGFKVLLVQHRRVELRAMEQMLSVLGCKVTMATESAKDLKHINATPHNMVIIDWDLLALSGFGLARYIKRCSPKTLIVITTACCQAEVVEYMDFQIVDDWLFKPFRLSELGKALERLTPWPKEVEWIT